MCSRNFPTSCVGGEKALSLLPSALGIRLPIHQQTLIHRRTEIQTDTITILPLHTTQKMNELGLKYCPLWMHLVAILTNSAQNQRSLTERRAATSILSCMHLAIMASCLEFQQHGWTTLGNVVGTPTPPGGKVGWNIGARKGRRAGYGTLRKAS